MKSFELSGIDETDGSIFDQIADDIAGLLSEHDITRWRTQTFRRLLVRRGPCLLGAIATTTVVAGMATAVSGAVSHSR